MHIRASANELQIIESLLLKKKMVIQLWVVITLYYANKMIYTILYTFIDDNPTARNIYLANYFVEIFIIGLLFFFLRARKWPDYFSVDL